MTSLLAEAAGASDLIRRTSSPTISELDNQMTFYERVKNTFMLELGKNGSETIEAATAAAATMPTIPTAPDQQSKTQLSPQNSLYLSQKRHSTTYEQKYFASILSLSQESGGDDQNEYLGMFQISRFSFINID